MSALAGRTGQTGALSNIMGTVSRNASWYEDIAIKVDDTAVTDADLFEWRMTFRTEIGVAADLTLSTTDATLVITQGATQTTLGIRVAATDLSALEDDYICDLSSQDDATRIIHWAHGIVSFRDEPVSWS